MPLLLTRRNMLAASASLPIALTATSVAAATHGTRAPTPSAWSFSVGAMTVTTLLDWTGPREDPKGMFGASASDEEWAQISEQNFISPVDVEFFVTPTLIDTGSELVLVDAGVGQGGIVRALAAADVTPDAIDVVVITHMHPDHIGGLMTDGAPTFPNARYITGATEYNFWSGPGAGNSVGEMVGAMVTPLAEKMSFVDDQATLADGVTALASFGHTPGHMCCLLESEGEQLVLTADLANHYVYSFARPDWAFSFDADPDAAVASRKNILGMLAADKIPMIGYHMPFPAAGFVEPRGDGFRFVPVGYQLNG